MSSSAPAPAPVEASPIVAQRYAIEAEIARGGMGVVYRVRELASGQERALKRLRVDAESKAIALRAAFEREYQVLASLDHPGIVRVHEYGVDHDGPFYVMDFVRGRDLREVAPSSYRTACRLLRDVASVLSLLHARRLLHRDLSPANVRLTAEGRCTVLDFGALGDFGYPQWIVGTPPMIAPEVLDGRMLDQRADLYALGALAYWLLTGRHAYPATRIEELRTRWGRLPPPPSAADASIPSALDALVLSLLSTNPLARPSSAAEVIARLSAVADLEPEPHAERRLLARSFLAIPAFVGRDAELALVAEQLGALAAGRGSVLRIEGTAGSGRTRFLEEAGVRAQLRGAAVLRVDATMRPGSHGTSRALAQRLFEALPELAHAHGRAFSAALATVGVTTATAITPPSPSALRHGELSDWFVEVSRDQPLVLQIDNAEYADDASLGFLVSLASRAGDAPVLLMFTERTDRAGDQAMGLCSLRGLAQTVALHDLTAAEMRIAVRSFFGDTPNVSRYADWLFGHTAGNPLFALELTRQLLARGVIHYTDGMWVLPTARPQADALLVINDVLSSRVANLSPDARALAQCLSLQRVEATLALCMHLSAGKDERAVLALLDELAQHDVLQREQDSFRFSSVAVREAVLASMGVLEREQSHLRLGRACSALSRGTDHVLRLEAGFHLIRGGHDLEGAALIVSVMSDVMVLRRLSADMYRIGPVVEAALQVLRRHRYSRTERMPLLCALAQAGYNEDLRWGELYGDDALDVLDEISGTRLARKLRFLGRTAALVIAISIACTRYWLVPKRARPVKLVYLFSHLFGAVTSSIGAAAVRLDGDRGTCVLRVLEPFSKLPRWSTSRSLYEFCDGLREIARDNQARAYAIFAELVRRFDDPAALRLLPSDARVLFECGAHYARGAFAIFRADGGDALASIERLEASGFRLYAMVGAQLRSLYHANRGELSLSAPHRARVDLHAAHFGSAWQVECWEAAALLPLYLSLDDATAVANLAVRLEELARTTPSMRRYARLAQLASLAARNEVPSAALAQAHDELMQAEPRSFIGWCASLGALARVYNERGQHREARAVCQRALDVITDDDRAYVSLYLTVDIQAAVADAALGHPDAALSRIEGLIARFRPTGHPLALGLLHEARARIAWSLRRTAAYDESMREVEVLFGESDTPALVAKCERLRELHQPADTTRGRHKPLEMAAYTGTSVIETELLDR